jgi:4-amino-4-deoxy-L-arabinose transferase-like glycosyltransferase
MHLNFVTNTSPDMLLAAIVYVSAGLILRIHRNGPTLGKYCLLGLLLGLGFLTKAMMLPLSAFFIACSVWPIRPWRAAMLYTLGTVLIFGAVAGPYIAELSKVKGHFTAGEAGYLNYVWHIDGLPFVHWQGAPSEFGTPLHPTRQIYASPLVYEFATKPGETYPPWDDPGYWMQGVRARFNWTEQLVATGKSLRNYRTALWSQTVLIVGVLVLLAMRQSWRSTIREFLAKWYVWLPALAAFAAYALIWVEGRYLPQFFVSVWAAMLILVKLPEGNDSQRLIRVVPLVVASLLGIRIASDFVGNIAEGYREVKLEMQIAEGLSAKKVTPGDRIAVVDAVLGEDWQKLLRLSIVAEIPSDEQNKFWSTSEAERLGIYQSLRTTGAKVLVAAHVPEWADTTGWKQIGTSPAYVLRLSQ